MVLPQLVLFLDDDLPRALPRSYQLVHQLLDRLVLSVTEGYSFTFTVTANENVRGDLVVDLTIPNYATGGEGENFDVRR